MIAPYGVPRRYRHRHRHCLRDVPGTMTGAVAALTDITAQRNAEDDLRHRALHDGLTALPNRTLLYDRVEHAIELSKRDHRPLSVLFVDLDDFKDINDTLGHDIGDWVLVEVGKRFSTVLRPGDTLSRLGGDEYAVLLENADEAEALVVSQRLVEVLRSPMSLGRINLTVRASVGVVTVVGDRRARDVLRDADLAMYAAKRNGKAGVEVFRSEFHEQAVRRHRVEAALRDAIEHELLHLVYQPIVSARTGEIEAVEALARWDHPELGPVPPLEFVPVAERAGLIASFGEWVLRHSFATVAGLREKAPIRLHVNVSVRELVQPGFADRVSRLLAEAGLDPGAVTLEVSEALLSDQADARSALEQLSEIGVAIAVDDFGMGYSSLDRLRTLPVNSVKIDRSFIAEITDERESPVATAIVGMARASGSTWWRRASKLRTARLRHRPRMRTGAGLPVPPADARTRARPPSSSEVAPLDDERSSSRDCRTPTPAR